MLEYEWGNPSTIMISGEEPTQDPEPTRPILDPYNTQNFSEQTHFINPETHFTASHNHNLQFHNPQNRNFNTHFSNYNDSLAYRAFGLSYPHLNPSGSTLDPAGFMVPKSEPIVGGLEFNTELTSRIGLNLGGRTYFSSEDDFVNRFYRRSWMLEPGSVNAPRCQAEGCDADLTQAKHYHRRHKVCEFHSKSATVIAAGLRQRFCQQCSRFHLLSEFDNGKRSCRRRLADHNRRRRKSNQSSNQENSNNNNNSNKAKLEKDAPDSSSENPERSPPDSRYHSSSSVTIAISPPRISLDYNFGHRPNYNGATTSSTASTSSSLFYSNSYPSCYLTRKSDESRTS